VEIRKGWVLILFSIE